MYMKEKLTSSSMLRAATELSSLKSIKEDASVRRKLPSVKWKEIKYGQYVQQELINI